VSSCGAASTLLAFNAAYAATGRPGGYFELPDEARFDLALADSHLQGEEFIFDVQGHFVNPTGDWTTRLPPDARPLAFFAEQAGCARGAGRGQSRPSRLLRFRAVHPGRVPGLRHRPDGAVLRALARRQRAADHRGGRRHRRSRRAHGRHPPSAAARAGEPEPGRRSRVHGRTGRALAAWPPGRPTPSGARNRGFWLDDEDTGIPFLEKARALGVNLVAVHKGLPFGPDSYEHSTCADIGRVARRYPDLKFLVYHSGYVPNAPRAPTIPTAATASTRWSPRCSRTTSRRIPTSMPNSAAPGAS
jgi:uncharacterized protein